MRLSKFTEISAMKGRALRHASTGGIERRVLKELGVPSSSHPHFKPTP